MNLDDRIEIIERRNQRVDSDKAWEKSLTRRISIAVITYFCASLLFIFVLKTPQWFLASCIPTMGYLLSTLGLQQIRKFWDKKP